MTYRNKGVKALNLLFTEHSYVHNLEDCIHGICDSQDDYNLIIF